MLSINNYHRLICCHVDYDAFKCCLQYVTHIINQEDVVYKHHCICIAIYNAAVLKMWIDKPQNVSETGHVEIFIKFLESLEPLWRSKVSHVDVIGDNVLFVEADWKKNIELQKIGITLLTIKTFLPSLPWVITPVPFLSRPQTHYRYLRKVFLHY